MRFFPRLEGRPAPQPCPLLCPGKPAGRCGARRASRGTPPVMDAFAQQTLIRWQPCVGTHVKNKDGNKNSSFQLRSAHQWPEHGRGWGSVCDRGSGLSM